MANVDFGRTADDFARHRAGFPPELFTRLRAWGIGSPGQRILDLGTGTGTLARGWAGQGCRVIGLDRSCALLSAARRLDAAAGVTVDYLIAEAEAVPLRDGSYDVITAGQCWHWFDRKRAAGEAWRLLRGTIAPGGVAAPRWKKGTSATGGWLVLAHFDWLPIAGNVVDMTEQLVERFNPAWARLPVHAWGMRSGMYPIWATDVAEAGFRAIETFSFDVDVPYSYEGWRGRMRASAGVAASLSAESVAEFDQELERCLSRQFPAEPLLVPHRVWALVCQKPVPA